MDGLTGVMCGDLDSFIQRSEFSFGCTVENGEFLRSFEHLLKMSAGRGKADDVFDCGTRLKNVQHELVGEVGELHGGRK